MQKYKHASDLHRREDPENYASWQQAQKENEEIDNVLRKLDKESGVTDENRLTASAAEGKLSHTSHPFLIKWEFFCQAYTDWQKNLDKYFPEVMGRSTVTNRAVISTMYALVLYYTVSGLFTNVYFKYSTVIRYQLLISAGILSYCAGTLWGYGLGKQFRISRLRQSPGLALAAVMVGCLTSLTVASYNYNTGYQCMELTCAGSIGMLYWMRHRNLAQAWHIKLIVPLLCCCIFSLLSGQYNASVLKETAATFVEEANLNDYFSLTSLVKLVVPKWMQDILTYVETETPTEEDEREMDEK